MCREEHKRGDGYSIIFEHDKHQNVLDQYVCGNCCIENENLVEGGQPYQFDPKIFKKDYLIQVNPTVRFGNFLSESVLNYNGNMLGEFLTHSYGSAIKYMEEHDRMVRDSQIRETQIQADSEYIFTGRDLTRMTGLYEDDLVILREYITPFQRSFGKITIDEAITIFFVYAR